MKNTQAEKDAGLTPDEAVLSPSDSAVKNADAALNAVSATNSYKPENAQPKSVKELTSWEKQKCSHFAMFRLT